MNRGTSDEMAIKGEQVVMSTRNIHCVLLELFVLAI